MYGVRVDVVLRPPALELHRKQHICGLGLAVRDERVVVVGEMRVVPTDVGETVTARSDVDDAGAVGRLKGGEQAEGQLEMAEVVGRELRFVATSVANERSGHD